MNSSAILACRLDNTGLTNSPFTSAADAVGHIGAVQAQDFAAAKWALGQRVRNATDAGIEREFNEGKILRTHVMRPTWHFVLPEDIRWMLTLTAPRVKRALLPYNRRLGLTGSLLATAHEAIAGALEGRSFLSRQELKAVLAEKGIATDVQRLGHIIALAELDGLVCSGPRRGKQFTYALLAERVKEHLSPDPPSARETLARRYFASHGPAQLGDFAWWSGLATTDARAALDAIRPSMQSAERDGRTYWFFQKSMAPAARSSPRAYLLSVYDEYSIAYRDRSDISDARDIERMIARGNALTAVIVLDGRVAGAWHRSVKKNSVTVRLEPFRAFTGAEQEALDAAIARYGAFTGLPVETG